MSLQINISPKIIPNIAQGYTDINRIFMEFIDNALDSAEDYFILKEDAYEREIIIDIKWDKKEFIISDNCAGIPDLPIVVTSIGDSNKKGSFITNGQFGFGIHSFLAACKNIEITTKSIEDNFAHQIKFERKDFNKANVNETSIANPSEIKVDWESGTQVRLSNFDKDKIKSINIDLIIKEIQRHFEGLLERSNLTIKINGNKCEAFDYKTNEIVDEYPEETLNMLTYFYNGKNGKSLTFNLADTSYGPITIYLQITKKQINKPPVLLVKGRRINEITHLQSFGSKKKSGVWGHQHITGFIKVPGDFLTPTIHRTDLSNDDKAKALFQYLESVEVLIEELLSTVNKKTEGEHYKTVENELNKALAKLAKSVNLRLRSEALSGNDINVEEGDEGNRGAPNPDPIPIIPDPNPNPIPPIPDPDPDDDPDDEGISDEKGERNIPSNIDADFEDTGFKGAEKKKHGLNILLVEGATEDEKGKMVPSYLTDGELRIFIDHPDFKKRQTYTQGGDGKKKPKVTQRLLSYMAGEITVHFEDKIVSKTSSPAYGIQLFKDLSERRNELEDLIQPMEGKNFSEYGE